MINKENQSLEPTVQHLVPRTFPKKPWTSEDWTVSVVVVYGYEHYQVLVPETLPKEVTITEGTTDSTGLQALIDISDGEEDVFTQTVVQTQEQITKYFGPTTKRQPQKKLKEGKNRRYTMSATTIMFPVIQMIQKLPMSQKRIPSKLTATRRRS